MKFWNLSSSIIITATVTQAAVLPKPASTETPWTDLQNQLTNNSNEGGQQQQQQAKLVLFASPQDQQQQWKEQCVDPFLLGEFVDGTAAVLSNYAIKDSASGLCLDTASCAYDKCQWPPAADSWPVFPTDESPFVLFQEYDDTEGTLQLPAAVLHPQSAADIVQAVEFANQHDFGITVKVAGHSYFGASTAKDTLLIKMDPSYPKYAIQGSLRECDTISDDNNEVATRMVCSGEAQPQAVLRVGGGELFDEAYRAVSIEWNYNKTGANLRGNKYHLVGGGAGTVAAAGGWMASGGLSGTTAMRMFGIGIDNVLALEMVLPNGQHVLFGSDAVGAAEYGIVGYCNAKPYENDESLWEWTECVDGAVPVSFEDLWFAVRGGGGGTWGIVTSVHYQVHEYPGKLQIVATNPQPLFSFPWDETTGYAIVKTFTDYTLKYLYLPAQLGVSEDDSRRCNSAQTFNINPFRGGIMFCYGTAGETFIAGWKEYVAGQAEVLVGSGITNDMVMNVIPNILVMGPEYESYAESAIESGVPNPFVPEGRMADVPAAALVPILGGYPYLTDSVHTLVSIQALQEKLDTVTDLLTRNEGGPIYAMGGAVPTAGIGESSLSPARRTAAILLPVRNPDIRNALYEIEFGDKVPGEDDFPGSSCHNHALVYEMGPLKSDWTKACPLEWEQARRQDECISQNEASWGTANLARLESVKEALDPNNLFICVSGVGYSTVDDEPVDQPIQEPADEPVDQPVEEPADEPVDQPVEEHEATKPTTESAGVTLPGSFGTLVVIGLMMNFAEGIYD